MQTFTLYDNDGALLPGAVPVFAAYLDAAGTSHPPPAIANLGGGAYGFEPSAADLAQGRAYLIASGPGAFPAYVSGGVGGLVAFGLYDADGARWAGAPPTFTRYDGTAPELRTLALGLFGFVPSITDRKAGASYLIAAPAGASPTYYSGTVPALASPAAVGPTMRLLGPNGSGTQTIKQGSLLPILRMQFVDAGGKPIDLTGCDVRAVVSYRQGAPPVVDAPVDVVDPGAGIAEYHWRPGDTDRPGILYVEGEVTDAHGRPMTLPSSGRGIVSVDPRLKP